ncbi:hypothetical protein B0H10DRAFT_2039837 [Mycena sp. CBHHK59/15]|nr:hypothetical protein B0H10DRAFT_2039837 [Mycena sp. CBHHK59/15]
MNFVKRFNYNVAATSSTKSPCSNIPLRCPECDTKAPAVWRYNSRCVALQLEAPRHSLSPSYSSGTAQGFVGAQPL